MYDDIARGTRCKFETNRPRAVLFEGPPGELMSGLVLTVPNPFFFSCLFFVLHCSFMLEPTWYGYNIAQ